MWPVMRIALIFSLFVSLNACSNDLGLMTRKSTTDSTNRDDDGGGGSGSNPPGGTTPGTCQAGSRTQNFSIRTNGIEGANILFVIDDSGSMSGEFQKVVWELRDFIDEISAASSGNYRMAAMFDIDGDGLNQTFYRDRDRRDPILDPNPFIDQIQEGSLQYIQEETWSKHSDLAWFRAFAPADFIQRLPNPVPVDYPGVLPSGFVRHEASECTGPGKYFRPRENLTQNVAYGGNPWCGAADQKLDVRDYFITDQDVQIVAISDDDMNLSFDRANFSFFDPNKNAYPEIQDLLITDLLAPLNAEYIYHSIVGPEGSEGSSTIERDGIAHLALTKKTSGLTLDLRETDWKPLFDELTKAVIFSSQRVGLACAPSAPSVRVKFNGVLLASNKYRVDVARKRIQFLPAAFEGFELGELIQVEVTYSVS